MMEYQKITKKSKNSEAVTNENDKEILKKIPKARYIYISRRKKQIIDNLRSNIIA